MMSIDHQKDHFKRSRDEEEEMEVHTQKKRKMEATASKEQDPVEFQKNMYRSYIKSALDALDNVSLNTIWPLSIFFQSGFPPFTRLV